MCGLVIPADFSPVHVRHHRRKAKSPGSVSNVTNTRVLDGVLSSQGTLGSGCGLRVLGHHGNRALVVLLSVRLCLCEQNAQGNSWREGEPIWAHRFHREQCITVRRAQRADQFMSWWAGKVDASALWIFFFPQGCSTQPLSRGDAATYTQGGSPISCSVLQHSLI